MESLSLQEVILNGDSPIPTRVIDGVVQLVAPTTAEQILARKNELKARETKKVSQEMALCKGVQLSDEELTNYSLMAFTSSSSSSFDNETSSKNLSKLLASQITDKTGLGYDNQVFNDTVFNCDDLLSSDSDLSMPPSPVYDRYKSGEGYHVVPPPYIETFMPPKPDLIFYDAPTVNETVPTVLNVKPRICLRQIGLLSLSLKIGFLTQKMNLMDCDYYEKKMVQKPVRNHAMRENHQHYARMTHPNPHRHVAPIAVLTRSRLVSLTAARPVTTVVPHINVIRPRPAKTIFSKPHSPLRRPINHRPTPKPSNFPQKVTTVKAPRVNAVKGVKENWGNPQHALKDKEVIDSGWSRHMTRNISYLSNFETINGGYVAFGKNPKGGKIIGSPKEKNTYNVDLENIIPLGDLTCLFAKATLDESNLWHRKLGHINFKTMNKLVKGKFDGKADEGFLVGYSISNKAFRVFNCRTRIVQETLHINFLENQPNVAGSGPTWLFDIDTLTQSMNYQPVVVGNQPNSSVGIQEHFDADKAGEGNVQQYVIFPLWSTGSKDPQNTDVDATFEVKEPESEVHVSPSSSAKTKKHADKTKRDDKGKSHVELSTGYTSSYCWAKNSTNSTNTFSAAGPSNTTVCLTLGKSSYVDHSQYPDDPDMPALEDITYSDDEEDVGAEADFSNLETNITVSHIPTTRVDKDNHVTQIIGNLSSATQTRSMTRMVKDQVYLPNGKRAIGSKWVFRNKKDERGIVVRNKARLVAHGHTQEKGIDYEEVFAPVARIEAIRLFLAYASFMGFMVHQKDVKSAFLYETIEEDVYVCQPPGFEDLDYLDKLYKVVKALYGLHQAPRAWYETLTNYLLENGFQKGKIDHTLFIKRQKDKFQMSLMGEITFFLRLQVKQKQYGIFISQDKYVAKILRKFSLTDGKSASTPIDTEKPLIKDPNGEDVDVHTYMSMIGSLMYLTSSRRDIMFAVWACARFQVTPKVSHLHAVKRIFRYLKGKPHLGLWYPKDSPFNLVAYSDSDYVGASLNRKSTTEDCQFLCCRLISWQCKKQTVVTTLSTEAEYVVVASCCAQVLWIQNQLLDYGLIINAVSSKLLLFGLTIDVVNLKLLGHKTNDVVRLQALIDRRKVIITEASVRQAIRLDDDESVDCLPNEEIFAELARMGYEKPSTKLTFYKAFFSAQWKFLIYTILQCMSAKRTAWNEFSSSMASAVICLAT
nr:putative ribonuclease H-like domain-containing protein [Tanacetum cinerariifolium]